jgi:PAS domain S-box-containing protein
MMSQAGDQQRFDPVELLAAVGQAVIATLPDGTVVFWNAGAERLYGWTTEEAVGRNVGELTVPVVSADMAADIMAALRKGVAWSGGFPVRRKDGTVFPALVTDSGIYRDGELVGLVGISANLGTALRPLLERSTDAAVAVRADAVITYASPAVGHLFGWDEDVIIGSSIVPLVHAEDRGALADFLTQVIRRPGAYAPLELRLRHADETWVWVEAGLTNMLDDPVVRGVVCNLHLSVARLARERAEERVAQLQQALTTRVIIEQAKGFLTGRDGVPPDTGFERLRRYARRHGKPLREVAAHLVDGTLALPPEE